MGKVPPIVLFASQMTDNDSYTALEAAGALFKPGPTGTNVNDLVIALA